MPRPSHPTRATGERDLLWLAVAVTAISTSGPLIRQAATPSLTLAVWRNIGGAAVLALVAVAHRPTRRAVRANTSQQRRVSMAAGVLLGLHFLAWIPSLSFTTVSSSTALIATQPVWAAVIARLRGQMISRAAWFGIALALAGTFVLSGFDFSVSKRLVVGDLLALLGGMLAAAYVTVGASARASVASVPFALYCFGAAGAVLVPIAIASGAPLVHIPVRSWLSIGALVVGAQLLGHFVLGRVLRTTGPIVVSLAILFEVVGATLLAWAWFGERPGWGLVPSAILILAGVSIIVRLGDVGMDDVGVDAVPVV